MLTSSLEADNCHDMMFMRSDTMHGLRETAVIERNDTTQPIGFLWRDNYSFPPKPKYPPPVGDLINLPDAQNVHCAQ